MMGLYQYGLNFYPAPPSLINCFISFTRVKAAIFFSIKYSSIPNGNMAAILTLTINEKGFLRIAGNFF
jgi:hypothetical protein